MSLAVTHPRPHRDTHAGSMLRQLRERAGISQQQLHLSTGFDTAEISRWENGHRLLPAEHARRLDHELGTDGVLERLAHAARRTKAGSGVRPSQLPCPPSILRGRDELLDEISHAAARATTVVLEGGPGVGKTALASAWAARQHPYQRWTDGILRADLLGYHPSSATPTSPHAVLTQFLGDLGVAEVDIPAETAPATRMLNTMLADRHVLLLLDNAHSAEQVRPVLAAAGAHCTVLVLTRHRMPGLAIRDSAARLTVPDLDQDDAVRLLVDLLPSGQRIEDSLPAVADACDRLPLALRAAALLLAEAGRHRTQAVIESLTGPRRLDVLSAAADDDPESALRVCWAASLRRLSHNDRRVLNVLAHTTDDQPIPHAILTQLLRGHHEDGEPIVALLREHMLLDEPEGLRMPGLLRLYLTDHSNPEPEL